MQGILKFKFVFSSQYLQTPSRNAIMKHERETFCQKKKIKNTSREHYDEVSTEEEEGMKRCPTELFAVLLWQWISFISRKKNKSTMWCFACEKNAFMRETIMINLYLTWLLLLSPWPSSCLLFFIHSKSQILSILKHKKKKSCCLKKEMRFLPALTTLLNLILMSAHRRQTHFLRSERFLC